MKIKQKKINWIMCSNFINWLIKIHECFHFLLKVFFLIVNYIDCFLSCKCIFNDKLQLVGIVALFIAVKFENFWYPDMKRLAYVCSNAYITKIIFKAEFYMLQKLNHNLNWLRLLNFLRRLNEIDNYNSDTRMLIKYLLEIIIMNERFVAECLSIIAAAAYCLARYMLKMSEWVSYSVLSEFNSLIQDLVTHTHTYF